MSNFVTDEKVATVQGALRLLGRFVKNMPGLRYLAIPAMLCAFFGSLGTQLTVWMSGKKVECLASESCTVLLPVVEWEVSISILLLVVITILVTVIRVIGWISFEVGGQLVSLPLFRSVIDGLARTRVTFFDENPSGRIINRVISDYDNLRFTGVIRIADVLISSIELIVSAVIIGYSHPIAAFAVLPTAIVFLYIQLNVAPMIHRGLALRSVRRSELLHRETDAIEGIKVFRLYQHDGALFRRLRGAMERFAQMHLLRKQVGSWGEFWSDVAAALCSFIGFLFVAYALQRGALSPVLAAVIVTALFRLSGLFKWLAMNTSMIFESAAHAHRVFEYVDLPHEEREEGNAVPKIELASQAVSNLRHLPLVFDDYAMSYREDSPVVLDKISLTIPYGSHVGLIGRTGAGKSSIVQSLFRMVYVRGGDIRLGETSIFSLPIEQSRSLFSIVPQDPYLFAGTVRSNIDPFHLGSDAKILAALSAVQSTLPLDHAIVEEGLNLSLGQRQLLCLARVIVSDAPYIVMDEPTSSVDTITDAIVQKVLRTSLRDRTVITIAHRLETLTLVDTIIELASGKVLRIGTPREMLATVTEDTLS